MTILQKHLVFIPLCLVAFAALFGWIVMLLWNWLMPEIFGWQELSFLQAVGLFILCKLLFGSMGFGHHHGHGGCHGSHNKLRERWEKMTPEERQCIIEMHKEDADVTSDKVSNGQ